MWARKLQGKWVSIRAPNAFGQLRFPGGDAPVPLPQILQGDGRIGEGVVRPLLLPGLVRLVPDPPIGKELRLHATELEAGCLPAYLPACLPGCLLSSLPACFPARVGCGLGGFGVSACMRPKTGLTLDFQWAS